MYLISINISNKSILADIKEILLKRYSLLREIDRLVLLTRINLLRTYHQHYDIINTIILLTHLRLAP